MKALIGISTCIAVLVLTSCTQLQLDQLEAVRSRAETQASSEGSADANEQVTLPPQLVRITVGVASDQANLLAEPPTDFKIEMVGCVTGYKSEATLSAPELSFYLGDSACVAELRQLRIDDRIYSAPEGASFAKGSVVVYEESDGDNNRLKVQVIEQISSPSHSDDRISFSFSETVEGNRGRVSVNKGRKAPAVVLKQFYRVGLADSADCDPHDGTIKGLNPGHNEGKKCRSEENEWEQNEGHGKGRDEENGPGGDQEGRAWNKNQDQEQGRFFIFELVCSEGFTPEGILTCSGDQIANFKYALIPDLRPGVPIGRRFLETIDQTSWHNFLDRQSGAFDSSFTTYSTMPLLVAENLFVRDDRASMILVVQGAGNVFSYFRINLR